MRKTSKKVFLVVVCLVLAIATSVALATDITINGATLNFKSSADLVGLTEGSATTGSTTITEFPAITLDVKNAIAPVTAFDYVRIDDDRGTAAGWNLKVAISTLTSAATPDATAGAGDTVVLTLPTNAIFKFQGSEFAAVTDSNSLVDNVTLQTSLTTAQTTGVTLLSAAAGYGAGAYQGKSTYTLSLSNYLPASSTVTPSDTAESALDDITPVTKVPILGTTYTTTITYAVTSGPL